MIELQVQGLHLHYGAVEVLKGVTVGLDPGQVIVLLGPSGSGKSTLLRAIAGLEAPSAGQIQIDGKQIYNGAENINIPAEQRNLGLVFQSYALWPHRTVFDNVAYPLRLRKVAAAEVTKRVETALDGLGLGKLRDRFPHQLSGGQQQRVAIARALVYSPPVVLLDEPLSNLDAKLREEAKAWLKGLIVELKLSAIVVTHDQSEAMAMGDKVVLLRDGLVVQEGTPEQIYNDPKNLFTAEFFGQNNRLDGSIESSDGRFATIRGDGWSLRGLARDPLPAGNAATAMIRVEQMRIADGPGTDRLPAKLVTSMFVGERWQHLFKIGDHALRAYSNARLTEDEHWIELPPEHLWIFAADKTGGSAH